jgi:hypothetical protein
MKDLDFDELDRAVSSLMSGVAKDTPVMPEPTEKILTIASTEISDNPTMAAPVNTQPVSAPAINMPSRPAPAQSPLVAKRPNGRFMDMVRSSPSTTQPTPRPVIRQGATIEPAVNSVADDMPEVSVSPSVDVAAKPQSEWPDPIDVAQVDQAADTPSPENVEVHHLADDEPLTTERSIEKVDEEDGPLQTPFLTDSKVEKRPLGAFNLPVSAVTSDATAATIPTSSTPEEAAIDPEEDAQLIPDPADVPVELPAELQGDVMAIEADETRVEQPNEPQPTSPQPQPQTSEIVRPAVASLGVTSIAQQYHTEPSTSDTEHAGIYDAEAYAQPLQHPVKKKSGWLWVLWIVLLLALGSGGAAVLYYLDII